MIKIRLEYLSVCLLVTGLSITSLGTADDSCLDSLPTFRSDSEAFYLEPETSPFDEKFRSEFAGFTYFNGDDSFCVDASYELSSNTKTIDIPTFSKETLRFREHGVYRFELEGKIQSLTAYQRMDLPEEQRQWVLVAFRDLTNGKETYGGGRYLEISFPIDRDTVLDFNRAANPFCAYKADFVCPMPPLENWLKVRIPVGELNYPTVDGGDI